MILNTSLLAYDTLEYLEESHLVIEDRVIKEINDGHVAGGINATSYLVIPSLINSHTHIGDSFAKEGVLGLNVDDAVGIHGKKWELYREVDENKLIECMKDTVSYMLNSGTTSFADFRENGSTGVLRIKKALKESPIKPIILGRDVGLDECDGLGLNTYQLDQTPKEREGKIVAVHAGEVEGEVTEALECKPDVLVHCTKATDEDIDRIAELGISVVVCPRGNAVLGAGTPNVRKMFDAGINVALGTDNAMICQPNMWREMEYLSKQSYLRDPIVPEEVFRMATSNGAKTYNTNSGVIEKGRNADLLFIDKTAANIRDNKNLIATLVHRCEPENVGKVMVDGRIVLDKDL